MAGAVFTATPGSQCGTCQVKDSCPAQRRGEAAVSARRHGIRAGRARWSRGVRWGAVELARALGQPHAPTPEQVAVIEAPLRPLLVVAGAGSGKTETMAARVVWLVANDLVRPDEVLGLTFTRKAAGELSERLSARLATLREAGIWSPRDEDGAAVLDDVPTVSTYHAYAGRIVREHGVRLGVEAESRLLSEAAAWQFAHEAVVSWDGPMDGVEKAESTVTTAVVDLAGEMAEHLVGRRRVAAPPRRGRRGARGACRAGSRKRRTLPARGARRRSPCCASGARCCPSSSATRSSSASRDAMDFADQVALAARIATHGAPGRAAPSGRGSGRCCSTSSRTPPRPSCSCCARCSSRRASRCRSPRSATRTSRSTAGAARARPRSHRFREDFVDPEPARCCPLSTSWRNDRPSSTSPTCVADPLAAHHPGAGRVAGRAPRGRAAATSPRPGSRRSRTRRGTSPPGSSTALAGRAGARQRCCAASVPSSTRSSRRWRSAASRTRSSASAACCTPRRSPTSSPCSGWCRTPPAATA